MRPLLASIALALLVSGCKTPGPHLVVPTPSHSSYVAVNPIALQALSVKDVWVAGDLTTTSGTPEGLLLWTDDAGKRWHRAGSEIHDLSNLSFTAVYFTDRLRGWVAGKRITAEGAHRGVVFRTKDGGNHWTEVVLPARDDVVIDDLHSVAFKSDTDGEVLVSYRDPKTAEVKESIYQTTDGGRVWTIASYLQEPRAKTDDRSVSYFSSGKTNGFQLRRSDRAGVTVLELTASAGKDWMPVSELSLSYIPSFY